MDALTARRRLLPALLMSALAPLAHAQSASTSASSTSALGEITVTAAPEDGSAKPVKLKRLRTPSSGCRGEILRYSFDAGTEYENRTAETRRAAIVRWLTAQKSPRNPLPLATARLSQPSGAGLLGAASHFLRYRGKENSFVSPLTGLDLFSCLPTLPASLRSPLRVG